MLCWVRLLCGCCSIFAAIPLLAAGRPNVVIVITDDQGYGDIGAHGNAKIKTPELDRLHRESIRLTNFHVDPTCAPTRSSLMTGRFSTRTGIWHTIAGRSLMNPNELTLAEIFSANGYCTGLFGKWHLGDNAPLRPQDQGFQKALFIRGGGITQSPDYWGNDYFDDTYLREDGSWEQQTGYCTDVWFREGMKFIEQSQADGVPFFCYIATNAPHDPFNVADEYSRPYREAGVPERMANFYGMITNIDENVGRLRAKLKETGLDRNTLFLFMTDNGTSGGILKSGKDPAAWTGFNAGMRAQKVSEYDGGHRVPCFIHWPEGKLGEARDISQLTAHIDLLPTFVEFCGLKKPDGPPIDGISLAPLLRGGIQQLPERQLFIHTQRVDQPVKWKNCVVLTQQWRLVNGKELYDIQSDPGQQSNVASAHPDVVSKLREGYEQWWTSLEPVMADVVRIDLGNPAENPTRLCCHDWHSDNNPIPIFQPQVEKDPLQNGFWAVNVTQPGEYEFTLRLRPEETTYPLPAGTARLKIGEVEAKTTVPAGAPAVVLKAHLTPGPAILQTWLETADGESRGAYYVTVKRL
ncbi:arylsulfatase [Planctomicrobium piriforme]|uniref:Arylsulfatase A n=1 Tax=Planctomicrobium piriforme TaxID=1576369 RepID=A0A1I3B6B2_9PLAN|nr:arylsulfatase [Planctomicrobium piriforme]SFH57818.1 Arylsulfatase A [Planctomicrobium piriforme]